MTKLLKTTLFILMVSVPGYGVAQSESAGTGPAVDYPESTLLINVAKCNAVLRKAMDEYFSNSLDVLSCEKTLYEIMYDYAADPGYESGLLEMLVDYQHLYSGIYENGPVVQKSHQHVKYLNEYKAELVKHINALNEIFLNTPGTESRNMAYINARNEVLLDSMVQNARLAINPATDSEKRIEYFDKMARDAVLVGKVLESMHNGNDKLKIKKVANSKARAELAQARKAFIPLSDSVGVLLDTAPDLIKTWMDFDDLNKLANALLEE